MRLGNYVVVALGLLLPVAGCKKSSTDKSTVTINGAAYAIKAIERDTIYINGTPFPVLSCSFETILNDRLYLYFSHEFPTVSANYTVGEYDSSAHSLTLVYAQMPSLINTDARDGLAARVIVSSTGKLSVSIPKIYLYQKNSAFPDANDSTLFSVQLQEQ